MKHEIILYEMHFDGLSNHVVEVCHTINSGTGGRLSQ